MKFYFHEIDVIKDLDEIRREAAPEVLVQCSITGAVAAAIRDYHKMLEEICDHVHYEEQLKQALSLLEITSIFTNLHHLNDFTT